MRTSLAGSNDPTSIFEIYKIYWIYVSISYFALVWDWIWHLPAEYAFIKTSPSPNGRAASILSIRNLFLLTRYLTLAWCTFVVVTWAILQNHPDVCAWFKYYTYGYSVVLLSAHFIMILRIHSIYERSTKILAVMLTLMVIDFGVQMGANHWVDSVLLINRLPYIVTCFNSPTSYAYILVFLSPTVFHHAILGLTLWKSIKHLRQAKEVGIYTIMQTIQRDHIAYVLIICLVNFANVVLVAQSADWPYRLINQLPAAVFTQLFLSRIVFNLKFAQLSVKEAAASPTSTLSPYTSFGFSPKFGKSQSKFFRSPTQSVGGNSRSPEVTAAAQSDDALAGYERRRKASAATNASDMFDEKISPGYSRSKISFRMPQTPLSGTTAGGDSPWTPRSTQISSAGDEAFKERHVRNASSISTAAPVYTSPRSPIPVTYVSPLHSRQVSPRTSIGQRENNAEYTPGSPRDADLVREITGGQGGECIEIHELGSPAQIQSERMPDLDASDDPGAQEGHYRAASEPDVFLPLGMGFQPLTHPKPARILTDAHTMSVMTSRRQEQRRSNATIDEEISNSDWQAPEGWESGYSGRTSPPTAYSVRGLEESLGIAVDGRPVPVPTPLRTEFAESVNRQSGDIPLDSQRVVNANECTQGHRSVSRPQGARTYSDIIKYDEGETPPDAPRQ